VTVLLILCALSLLTGCARQPAKARDTPTPFTLPSPPCDHDAQVLQQAQPEWPDSARNARVHEAQVGIRVEIAPTGRLKKAKIVQSSFIPALDTSALLAAEQSTYEPATKHCKPVAGSYMFRVTFSSNG
jgi:TonB family protein